MGAAGGCAVDALVLFAATGEPTLWSEIVGWTWSIGSVAVGLGFVIFVHELGHFLVAKACGVKCEKFYIGFDIFNLRFCRFQWGETEYGIGALPLGGYVKMLGQDDDPRHAMAEAERIKVRADGTAAEGLTSGTTVEQPQKYELDPRSYPAKSVPARMAIISAGVIMNVIFGVLLAAWAYWLGVPETPAIVGSTVPGSPAWTANLRPGMKFIAFGTHGTPYDHFRFEDVQRNVVFTGEDRELRFVVRTRDGEEKSFAVQPTSRAIEETKLPTVGFQGALSNRIGEQKKAAKHLAPHASVPLQADDVIVAVNGIPLKNGTAGQDVFDYRLGAELARHPHEPVTLLVERTPPAPAGQKAKGPPKRIEVVIEPRPCRTVGLQMKIGPVVAVREGSPAKVAGFKAGDLIRTINGEEVGDPLSLAQRLARNGHDQKWTVVVSRKDSAGKSQDVELSVQPQLPEQFAEDYPLGGPVGIEAIGIAFDVTRVVEEIEDGSPAAQAGVKAGDVVIKAAFEPIDAKDRELQEELFRSKKIHDELVLDDNVHSWTHVHTLTQAVLPRTKLVLTLKRGDQEVKAAMLPVDADNFFQESRGIPLMPVKVVHLAKDWREALYLGMREVRERVGEVIATIGALATGRVSSEHLSGPAGIIHAAGVFASRGLPWLLLFLTMLSANLAVLNILPIPVLDGGHLLFLSWEGITRKPVNPNVQGYLSLAGLVLLLLLMIYATKNDLTRFFS
jgi:regulator of sigma E protease